MSRNFEVKTKRALFLNGEQKTDFDWDHFNIDNVHEIIVATDEEKHFALFNLDGDLLFEIEDCIDYEITSNYILLKIKYLDLPVYGMLSFEGELLLPFGLTSIESTESENVVKIKMTDWVFGYYILSTRQLILNASEIKLNSAQEYSFFIENEWKKYSLLEGEFKSIN